jgi:glutamate-5-semialdehyde dehydrogenase
MTPTYDFLKKEAFTLRQLSSAKRTLALEALAKKLDERREEIKLANQRDITREKELRSMLDRLSLGDNRINNLIKSVLEISKFPCPLGRLLYSYTKESGMVINKVSVPLGVIGMVYEGRPNVTVEAAALSIKSGNAILLRGSSQALNSNQVLVSIIQEALTETGLPSRCVTLFHDDKRDTVIQILTMRSVLDVIVPRGSGSFIKYVRENATLPVIETGAGNCHIYIAETADPKMASKIVIDAKCDRPSVCNSIETLLVNKEWARSFLKDLVVNLKGKGVLLRGCKESLSLSKNEITVLAQPEDYATEFLDLILAVKVVANRSEALEHIAEHSTKHSEGIITESVEEAKIFHLNVDAAVTYHNASTRFSDGGEFGMGGEFGISTQKLHVRGPIGVNELTTYKYEVSGVGDVRGKIYG